ncbi:MAG: radical SAM family heme chaperone HemW [Myxococcota bacterium]|nr:radical SAM family heme chaperone HemW [Myxococcota bacterium]
MTPLLSAAKHLPTPFSIYVHLPFCQSRCPYCDFFSVPPPHVSFSTYRTAVHAEWQYRRPFAADAIFDSLYIGGGTPSLWPLEDIKRLISLFSLSQNAEISIEVNPADASERLLGGLSNAGVTRLSIGVQALDDTRLDWLGRRHDRRTAETAVRIATQSGLDSVGADIIYGTPGQTSASLTDELRALIDLGIDHVSAYELTISPRTILGRRVAATDITLPTDDDMATLWYTAGETLATLGFERYEVSNYARPGHRSRHNAHYWQGGAYVGLGAGAHGFFADNCGTLWRYANGRSVPDYVQLAGSETHPSGHGGIGKNPVSERVDPVTYARERMMLGLRTSDGIPLGDVFPLLPPEIKHDWQDILAAAAAEDLVHIEAKVVAPTEKGMLLADTLALRFF